MGGVFVYVIMLANITPNYQLDCKMITFDNVMHTHTLYFTLTVSHTHTYTRSAGGLGNGVIIGFSGLRTYHRIQEVCRGKKSNEFNQAHKRPFH